jgi:hypothetical protein
MGRSLPRSPAITDRSLSTGSWSSRTGPPFAFPDISVWSRTALVSWDLVPGPGTARTNNHPGIPLFGYPGGWVQGSPGFTEPRVHGQAAITAQGIWLAWGAPESRPGQQMGDHKDPDGRTAIATGTERGQSRERCSGSTGETSTSTGRRESQRCQMAGASLASTSGGRRGRRRIRRVGTTGRALTPRVDARTLSTGAPGPGFGTTLGEPSKLPLPALVRRRAQSWDPHASTLSI